MTITDWAQSITTPWRGTRRPPFSDLEPTVEWQVNGVCNYACSYCIQSPATRVGVPDDKTVDAIVDGFARLPGVWEIKMSGGEPFAFKGFVNHVMPNLVAQTPHRISILTNFSAPIDVLRRFCMLTGNRLRITSASLHPDSVDLDVFIDKAIAYREIRAAHNPHSSFVVNVVLVPGHVSDHLVYRRRLEEHGLRYFPQWMKIKGGIYPYTAQERSLIQQLTEGSHNPREINRAPSYRGTHCEAGAWYFIVDQTGEAFVCRTAKRFWEVDDRGRLGNIASDKFRLRTQGGPCPYSICPCTVPVNRGIVRISGHQRQDTGGRNGD